MPKQRKNFEIGENAIDKIKNVCYTNFWFLKNHNNNKKGEIRL